MKLEVILVLGAVVATSSLFPPAVSADTYSSVTTTESLPLVESRETRTVIENTPTTVIREQPVIIQPADREVIVVKRHHHHHLIDVGPVRVF